MKTAVVMVALLSFWLSGAATASDTQTEEDQAVSAKDREAALLTLLRAIEVHNDRIHHHGRDSTLLRVNNDHVHRHAYLRSSESDALLLVHRVDHALGEQTNGLLC